MRTSRIRQSFAAGASVAIAAAGLAAFAPAASAISAALPYACTLSTGGLTLPAELSTVADTNIPDKVTVGTSTPVTVKADITVPSGTADLARGLGSTVAGTAKLAGTIDGVAAPGTATLAPTPTGATGQPLVLTVNGTLDAPYAAATVGAKVIKLATYTADLTFTKADGTKTQVAVNCPTTTATDTTVDKFEVVAVPTPTPPAPPVVVQETETSAAVKYKKKAQKVVAKLAVTNEDDTAASGDVKVILKKGTKKVGKAVTVTLNKAGKKSVVFKKVAAKGKYTLIAKYKGSDESKKSMTKVSFKIK